MISYHYTHGPGSNPWSTEIYNYDPIYFNNGQWYNVTQRLVKNTFTGSTPNADGINEIWVDGRLIYQESNLILLADNTKGIDGMFIGHYYGGSSVEYQPIHDVNVFLDNIAVWMPDNDPITGHNLHSPSTVITTPYEITNREVYYDQLITSEGTLHNTQYGTSYSPCIDEAYLIDAGAGNTVSYNLGWTIGGGDAIFFYDGNQSDSDLLRLVKGYDNSSNQTVTSTGRYLFVRFSSNTDGGTTGFTGTITFNTGTSPIVTIAATDAAAGEAATPNTGTFTVSRTGATTAALTVNFSAPTGTATLTTDYTLSPSGGVTIPIGSSTATVTVTPVDDASAESSETVIRTLTTGTGYTVGSPSSATVTIADNDDLTNVALNKTATQSSTENGGVASRGVDGNTSGVWANNSVTHTSSDMNAWWEVDLGQVYNISSIQVWNRTDCCMARMDNFYVFLANSFTSYDLTTTLNQSGIWKSSQQTTYPNPSYTCNPGTSGRYVRVQLGDQDNLHVAEVIVMGSSASLPTVTISATDAAAGEATTPNTGTFTVSRTGPTTAALTVNFSAPTGTATLTTDYTLSPSGSVTIPIGSTTTTVTITPVDDSSVEGSETVILSVTSGTGYTNGGGASSATVTIADNDFANVALNKTATQSSTAYGGVASRGVDGNTSGEWSNNSVTHTASDMNAWWQVDLGEDYQVSSIQVWNRTDPCCMARMDNFYVFLADTFTSYDLSTTINQSGMWYVYQTTYPNPSYTCYPDTEGRYVRVQLGDQAELNVAEVIVTGYSLKSAVINSGNEVILTKEQKESRIKVFPNPGSATITVSGFSKALELRILDVLGKEVYRAENISNSAEVDVSNFRKGMYLILLKEENKYHMAICRKLNA